MAYIQPQLQIFQEFSQLPQNVVANLNAFVTGPHYKLLRYSEAAEKQFTLLGEYAAGEYGYPAKPFGSIVDTAYVKLFMEDVLARYASVTDEGLASLAVTGVGNNQITAVEDTQDLVFAAGNGALASQAFRTRGVKVGDTVKWSTADDEGFTRVVGFIADAVAASVAAIEADAVVNAAPQVATDLSAGVAVTSATGNVREFTGSGTGVFALSGSITEFPGVYSAGVLSEQLEVEITTGGAPGAARCTVRSVNGTFVRTNVPVEAGVAAGDALIYLGRNMVMNLIADEYDTATTLSVGDIYTMDDAADAVFTAINPATGIAVAGTYTGVRDTVYAIHVVRGGVFTRNVSVIDGVNDAGADAVVVAADVDFDGGWLVGDVDDEYVIRCTTAGGIGAARFSVQSLRGDNDSNLSFTDGVERSVGTSGLKVTVTADEYSTFAVGDFWVVKVNACRPRIQVTDSRGTDQGTFTVITADQVFSLGLNGLTAEFNVNANAEAGFAPGGGLVTGDKFYARATAVSSGAYRTIVTEDALPAGEAITAIEFYLSQASVEITSERVQAAPLYNWEADADGITVNAGIAVQDPSWVEYDGSLPYIPVVSATMYAEYRALLQDYVGSIFSFETVAQVTSELGVIDADNPLALGVYKALENSGGQPVYFTGLRSDDLDGYLEVFELIEKLDTVYSIVALSTNREIVDAVKAHVLAMSAEDVKRWRIGWCSTELPETTELMNAELNNDEEWLATVTGTGNRTLDITNANAALVGTARVGDYVRLEFATDAWGSTTWDEIRIEAIASNSRITLETGTSAAINEPAKIEVFRRNRASEIAATVAAVSESLGSRRMYHVAPLPVYISGSEVSPVFAAAAMAGLVSSMAPQRPLSNITVTGFSEIPDAYRTFTRADLNTMAAGGTFILAQDKQSGAIYVRHQLSTATSDGNLLTSELSVVKNLDAISYYYSGVLSPYIGRYNITPELLATIRTDLEGGLSYLKSPYTGTGLLGPMVLDTDATALRLVQQHPTLKDHIVAVVDLDLPLPVNVIQLRLVV